MSIMIKMNRHILLPSKIKIPVYNASKEAAANEVTKERWDHGFPNVVADCNVWRAEEDGERDEVHICNDVVGTETYKTHDRKPNANYFGDNLARGYGEEDCHADEPVTWWLKQNVSSIGLFREDRL
jgi:hypothetical protein